MDELTKLLKQAKSVAQRYRRLTGKPPGITGEVAEFSAARLLGLELTEARQSRYDAIRQKNGKITRVQIKGRCIPTIAKPGQRLGSIQLNKKWDAVMLVILDEDLEVQSIYEADRASINKALLTPSSKARNERGALSVSKFKSIGKLVWPNGLKLL